MRVGHGSSTLGWLLVGLLATGCGSGNNPPKAASEEDVRRLKLEEVWGMYKLHQEEQKRPPAAAGDLKRYQNGFISGFEALQSGLVVVRWGATVPGPGTEVFAFVKDAPTSGGQVLMADGSIQRMTADEFKAAPQAKSR
jgi:hypothetical protein